jgi:vitamin K-dependent gamma-carboxylase-like protein
MRWLERWFFAPGPSTRLAALRIGLCSLLAVRLTLGPYLDMTGQPSSLFRPISFMHLLPAMPPKEIVLPLQVIGVAAALIAAVGFRARLTLPLGWACAVLLNGMLASTGKVVHNDVLLLLCLVPLLPARVSDAWSLDVLLRRGRGRPARALDYGWPVRTATVVVAGAYFFAGFAKLVYSGPAWVTSDNMRWILYSTSHSDLALLIADRPWLAHVLAGATLLLELAFPLVLWKPRTAWLFVPAAIGLHTGIWLAMGLDYSAQAATVLVVLTNWPEVVARLKRRVRGRYESAPDTAWA